MTHDEGEFCLVQPDPEHNNQTYDTDICSATAAQPVVHDDDSAGGEFPLPDDHQGGRAAQRIHFVMAKILKSNNKEASPGNPLGLAFLILEV